MRFAADLKKMLPQIPKVRDFAAFRDAGRELGRLHMATSRFRNIRGW
jgi:predicted helicase